MTKQEIVSLIMAQVQKYNENLDNPVDLSAGEESKLFGKEGVLSSVDFINLLLNVEVAVENATNQTVTLSMSQDEHFRTIGTFSQYVYGILTEVNNNCE